MKYFTKIQNNIIEKLYSAELSGSDFRVMLLFIRKINGYHKKEDWLSYSQMQKITGLSRYSVSKSIQRLVKANYLVCKYKPFKYSINYNINQWVVSKSKLVCKCTPSSYRIQTSVVSKYKPPSTKENNTKENIQKKEDKKSTQEYMLSEQFYLSLKEHEVYKQYQITKEYWKIICDAVIDWGINKGKKIKNYPATFRNFMRRDIQEGKLLKHPWLINE